VEAVISDRHASFIFSGTVRHESERGLLIQPRDFKLPRTAAEWFPKRLAQILARDPKGLAQVSVPLWLAKQKFPAEALVTGGESTRPRSAA
jgi:hypothetical protein